MSTNFFRSLGGFLAALGLVSLAWGYSLIVTTGSQAVAWPNGSIAMKIMVDNTLVLSDGSHRATSIQTAMQLWNSQIQNVQFSPQIVAVGGGGAFQNGVNEIFFAGSSSSFGLDENTLAITTQWWSGNQRQESDIVFNPAFSWDSYRGPLRSDGTADIQRVALHELGHVLGLDHPDENGQTVTAVMNSVISDVDSLQTDDITGAQSLYGVHRVAPTISIQPADKSAYVGQSVQFATAANGYPPPGFRWQRQPSGSATWSDLSDGGNYSGTGTNQLSVAGLTAPMNGDKFRCVASNALDNATSNAATLTVITLTAPGITSQPSSQTVLEGATVTFTAAANGVPAPTLQWQKNGVDISGATGSSYTISVVLAADAGSYRMVATNLAGNAASNSATLTVHAVPGVAIPAGANRQVLVSGQALSLGVTASGEGPFTYQWIHNGRVVAGATSSSLAVAQVNATDGGWYVAIVGNSYGSRRSAPLFVSVAPQLTQLVDWGNNPNVLPAIPIGLNNVIAIDGGDYYSLALRADGSVVSLGNQFPVPAAPAGLTGVVAVSAGQNVALALKADGTVVSWGDTFFGGLMVPAGVTDVVAVSAGSMHSLALHSDGTVFGWGVQNVYGEATSPVGLSGVVAVAAGGSYSLALKNDGSVVGWGDNSLGKATVPAGLGNVIAVSAGFSHALALKADGTVVAWGSNDLGQAAVPAGLNSVVAVAAGYNYSLALKADGTVVAWGSNDSGQSSVPEGLGQVIAIGAARSHSLVLRDAAGATAPVFSSQPASQSLAEAQPVTFSPTVSGPGPITYQWRKNGTAIAGATFSTYSIVSLTFADAGSYDVIATNFVGSTTSAAATLTVNPAPTISSLTSSRQVVNPGQALNLSVTASGSGSLSYQWFRNGRPISGKTASTYTVNSVTLDDAGWYQVYVKDSNGTKRSDAIFVTVALNGTPIPARQLRGWGSGYTNPPPLTDVVSICSSSFSALLRADGSIAFMGAASNITLPNGLSGLVAMSAGSYHILALKADGTVVAFTSDNGSGQATVPSGLNGVVAVAAGSLYSLALKSDGTVVAWGSNSYGQTAVPAGLSGVVAIAASPFYSLALKADGTVVTWGGTNGASAPVAPGNLTDVIAISAGNYHALALKRDGTAVEWGTYGAGPGALTAFPVGLSNVVGISAGAENSFAIKGDGTVVGWGYLDFSHDSPVTDLDKVRMISTAGSFYLALRDATGDTAPSVSIQPVNQTLKEAETATFAATVHGAGPWSYQWRRNGVNLVGETHATLVKEDLATADAGAYDVVVTNGIGSTTSNPAQLTVIPIPAITYVSPNRQVISPGKNLNLAVTATGVGTLSYQWSHNNRVVTGATSANYSMPAVTYAASGWYNVVVTDTTATRRSKAFFVKVAPAITQIRALGTDSYYNLGAFPAGLTDVVDISATNQALALRANGTVVGWGLNSSQQAAVPSGLSDVVAISAGHTRSLVLKADGTVVGWGSSILFPVPSTLKDIVAIAAGQSHSMALKADGTVVVWGANTAWSTDLTGPNNGVLNVPAGLSGVVGIAAGDNYSLAVIADGSVVIWGQDQNHYIRIPPGLTGVVGVSGNSYATVATRNDGSVVGWSYDSSGIFGLPSGLINPIAVAPGLAVRADATAIAWNGYGNANPGATVLDVDRAFAVSLTEAAGQLPIQFLLRDATVPNSISYGSTNFPASATVGSTINFTYSVTNTGTNAWGANHYLALRDANQTNLAFASLDGVATGASKTANFTLVAPAVAGTYTYYIQGVEAGVEFFSTKATLTLTVTGAPKNAASYDSTTFPATTTPGATINFTYSVKNTGTQAWGANHYLALRDASQTNLAFASLSGVAVGGSKTASLSLVAPSTAGTYTYYVQGVEAGAEFFSTRATLTLTVAWPKNFAAYTSTTFPATATSGATINFTYTVTNMGTQAWGANHYLALRDATQTNLAFASLSGVAIGASKTAGFTLIAPTAAGTYTYYVQGVEAGVEFFSTRATLTLTVTGAPKNAASYNSTTFPASASVGTTINFTYSVTNTGTQAWGANHYLALRDASQTNLAFASLSGVAIGGSKTSSFSLVAPSVAGTYTYYVQGVEAGVEFFGTRATLILTVTGTPKNAMSYQTTTFPVKVTAGTAVHFSYHVTNTGTKAWGAQHYLSLRDGTGTYLEFIPISGVAVNGGITVNLDFTAPATAGTYTYYVQGVENGVEFFGTQATLTLVVPSTPLANAMRYNSTTFPASAAAGSTVNFTYNVTNTGTHAWGAQHYVSLRNSAGTYLAFAPVNGIAIGASTTVNLSLVAPATSGTYTYYVEGVENGVEFFSTTATLILTVP